jgi:ribosome recycling factor
MPSDLISQFKPAFEAVMEHLKQDAASLRTGRATPSMVDGVQVEAYGAMTALVGLASISNADSRTLSIEPWDKSLMKVIETALTEARLGANPVVAGTVIRLPMPPLTEESRRGLVKVLGEKLEHARISVRNVRDEVKSAIQQAEKDKDIDEDAKYRLLEQLDKMAAGINERIKSFGEEKETEIMTV